MSDNSEIRYLTPIDIEEKREKYCRFKRSGIKYVDYKEPSALRPYITDRGKISPRRKSGNCAKHQRALATAIKRARHLALLPFVAEHVRQTGGVGIKI